MICNSLENDPVLEMINFAAFCLGTSAIVSKHSESNSSPRKKPKKCGKRNLGTDE
jgi:hypothetical protein